MPHRAEPTHGYEAQMGSLMRGTPSAILGGGPPGSRLLQPSEAAHLAASHPPPQAPMYGYPPASHMHPRMQKVWREVRHDAPQLVHIPVGQDAHHRLEAAASHDSMQRRSASPHPASPHKRLRQTRSSDESPEETAVSALLMASSGKSSSSAHSSIKKSKIPSTSESETPSTRKKRKKHLDVLRRNNHDVDRTPASGPPCHVSPVSSASMGSHPESQQNRTPERTSSHTDSFELKEEQQALTESSKIRDTSEIVARSSSADTVHFPTLLHKVLGHSDVKNVLQWLPHGKAWRVVRWDALRRNVLPRYFAQLSQEKEDNNGKVGLSLDSFLWHVWAWGFEEIKDGPDVGAYRHSLFVRENPKLCEDMRFSSDRAPDEHSPKRPTTGAHGEQETVEHLEYGSGEHVEYESGIHISYGSPNGHRRVGSKSILRVPSLASRSDGERDSRSGKSSANELTAVEMQQEQAAYEARLAHHMHGDLMHEQGDHVFYNWHSQGAYLEHPALSHGGYPMEDERYVRETAYYHVESPRMLRSRPMFPPPYDPRFPFRPHPEGVARGPPAARPRYSPPRVRSGRAGARSAAVVGPREPPATKAAQQEQDKSAFPVSQRGKALSRRPCRVPLQQSVSSDSGSTSPGSFGPQHQVAPPSSEAGAMMAVRKTQRRKLPLARKSSNPPDMEET